MRLFAVLAKRTKRPSGLMAGDQESPFPPAGAGCELSICETDWKPLTAAGTFPQDRSTVRRNIARSERKDHVFIDVFHFGLGRFPKVGPLLVDLSEPSSISARMIFLWWLGFPFPDGSDFHAFLRGSHAGRVLLRPSGMILQPGNIRIA